MDLQARVVGVEAAERYLRRLQGGAAAATRVRVRIGTAVVYAWGVNFGRARSGRLARRAGGTFALPGAFAAVHAEVAPALAAALPDGEQAVERALLRLGYRVEAGAKAREAVQTGNLRRSYHTVADRR